MTTTERNILAVAIVGSCLWAGGLATVYLLQSPAAPTLADYELNPATPRQAAAVDTARANATAAAQDVVAATLTPNVDERRQRLVAYWQSNGRTRQAMPPQARLFDQTGVILPAPTTAPAKTVTLHLKDVTPRAALAALGKAAGARYLVAQPDMFVNTAYPPITLDADNQPLMHVLGRLCGLTGLTTVDRQLMQSFAMSSSNNFSTGTPDRPLVLLQQRQPGEGPGPRVTAGAFSFEVRQVERTASLDANAGPANNSVCTLSVSHEPGVVVVAQQMFLKPTEAVDEAGHSLVEPAVAEGPSTNRASWSRLARGIAGAFSGQSRDDAAAAAVRDENWQRPQENLMVQLSCPANAGRTIATLKASPKFLIRTKIETIELAADAPGVTKDVAGMKVTLGPLATIGPQQFNCEVKFERAKLDAATWQRMRPGLNATLPTLQDKDGRVLPQQPYPASWSENNDAVTMRVTWRPRPTPSNNPAPVLTPAKLTLVVPAELTEVTVPIEFKDLPLP